MTKEELRQAHIEELRQAHIEEIAYLTQNPDQISTEWVHGADNPYSIFFMSPKLLAKDKQGGEMCLTLAKKYYDDLMPESQALVNKLGIMEDDHIKENCDDLEPQDLESFSKYQIMLAFGEE